MKPDLELAPWELASTQNDALVGAVDAGHLLHLEGETRFVRVRFAPDVRGQFLMFLRRVDDGREGNWTVKERYRLEAQRFKAPYSPELGTVRKAMRNGLGRVFHFEKLDERFGDERLKGVWRVWLGADGVGSWTSLHSPAPQFVFSQWGTDQEFVFRVDDLPKDWHKQSAVQWRDALEEELQNPGSDARFALDFARSSHSEQENARLRVEKGTARQLREVLKWLVQTHEPFWTGARAWLWEVRAMGEGDFSYSGGGSGEDEIWEFVNRPTILWKWGQFVFEKMGVAIDEDKVERHLCLQPKFCKFYDSIFDLRVEAPASGHERMEAVLEIRDWVAKFAPEDGEWLLPS